MAGPGPLLLVHTNREMTPEVVLPIGLARVADACARAGLPVQVLDLAFVRKPEAVLAATIQKLQPALVGFAVRNIDNADAQAPIYYLPPIQRLVQTAREHTKAPIVAGGTGVSIAPVAVRAAMGVDCAVSGPGETTLIELWGKAISGEPLPEVAFGEHSRFDPVPDFARWLDLKPYRRRGAPLAVQSRRGCPFHCVYCNYAAIEGTDRYELSELSRVVDGIAREAERVGVRDVEFVDSTFNAPPKFARELCRALARADLGLEYRASGINPRFADRETLVAMQEAGFGAIMCSPDTASPAAIEAWGKDFELDQLTAMAADSAELGLPVMWSFMFGGPGETEATVQETLDFAREAIDPDHPVMLTSRMRIYPGTSLARTAELEGYPPPQLDPFAERQFYLSEAIDSAWLDERLAELQRDLPNVMFMEGSQSKAIPWIHRVRALFGVSGPAWTSYARTRRRLKRFGVR